MLIQESLSVQEKLRMLTDTAKHSVTCTSSGIRRKGRKGSIGNTSETGICHNFSADGGCISSLEILFTNQCIYDHRYCVNRCSNNVVGTAFTLNKVCKLTIEFYHRNCTEGLFLSSGILYNANHTMESIYETLYKLRNQRHFNGYIHVKTIPGAGPELVEWIGSLADHMSINLGLPTAEGLKNLAPRKTRDKILKPMRQIQQGIAMSSHLLGYDRKFRKTYVTERAGFAGGAALIRPEPTQPNALLLGNHGLSGSSQDGPGDGQKSMERIRRKRRYLPDSRYAGTPFVPVGQSAQTIVGATPEDDYQVMAVTQALYENYNLKRIFCSAYAPVNGDSYLPSVAARPLLLRGHRLYQADWLLRFYGFKAEGLLSEERSNFNVFLDPRYDWALRHLELFPMGVNRISYRELLRAPGVGVESTQRVVNTRKQDKLLFEDLKKMGVVLKRARYFIACEERMMEGVRLDQDYITSCLVRDERHKAWGVGSRDSFRQLGLFDDMHLEMPVTSRDHYASVTGSL